MLDALNECIQVSSSIDIPGWFVCVVLFLIKNNIITLNLTYLLLINNVNAGGIDLNYGR